MFYPLILHHTNSKCNKRPQLIRRAHGGTGGLKYVVCTFHHDTIEPRGWELEFQS
jgi:hypothetical protein